MEVIDGLPNAEYHRRPELGSTSLKTLARPGGPAKWKWEQDHPRTYSSVFEMGTVVHSVILEEDWDAVHLMHHDNYRTKDARAERDEARAAGKIPLLLDDYTAVRDMYAAVNSHPEASALLRDFVPERSIFWNDSTGLGLKCRPDALRTDMIVDLKTCQNADPNEFGRTAYNFGYHQQAAHYMEGVAAATGEALPFKFILVEKTAPYLVSVVELDEDAIELGREMNNRAVSTFHDCRAVDHWPGYPTIEPVSLPNYAYDYDEDVELKL